MQFLHAERTSNWELHLITLLPSLAATGHFHYAKSAPLYLRQMQDLPRTHPHCYMTTTLSLESCRKSGKRGCEKNAGYHPVDYLWSGKRGWSYATITFVYRTLFCLNSTLLAIAGDDFSVVASDLRLSEGFMIHSRECPKSYNLWVLICCLICIFKKCQPKALFT